MMEESFAVLEYNGRSELIKEGVPTSLINLRSQYYCDNKQLTKSAYEALQIPHPKSITFQSADEPAIAAFFREGQTYVCKPLDGTNGLGVVTDIQNMEMVKSYLDENQNLATRFMLEEQVGGEDLRIHVLGGKIIAACIREPACVIGNGKDDLKTLIAARRAVMHTQNPNNFLAIDQATKSLLAEQKISLEEVPAAQRKIQLKYVSNMAQGGIATDVTDDIHPVYHQWVADLSNYLNTGYFGLDLMTTNYAGDPNQYAEILEINARADWLHHTFSERRTHDIARMILEEVFGTKVFLRI